MEEVFMAHANKRCFYSIRMALIVTCIVFTAKCGLAQTASNQSAWKPVENAMGRSGKMQPGDVLKFSMPRKDMQVMLNGVQVKPGLALGSWAAFHRMGTRAIVMGDLVLTEEEVEPVM